MTERLEIRLVINGQDVCKIDGEAESDDHQVPSRISKPTYSYSGVQGIQKQGDIQLSEAMEQIYSMVRNSGRDYKISLELTRNNNEESTEVGVQK